MPIFRIKDPNTGKTIKITSKDDTPPTQQELEQIFAQQQPRFGRFGGGITRGAGAGGAVPVPTGLEARIAQRPDILQQAGQAARGAVEQFRQQPFRAAIGLEPKAQFGMPFLQAAGGLAQRGLAVPANIAEQLQAGRVSPLGLGRAGLAGLTGERLGELGDVARRAGWPEPIAATLGFFASMGGINLATRGKLVESTRKAGQFVTSKVPKVMGKDYLINRAKLAGGGIDDLYDGLSREYDDLFNVIGQKPLYPGSTAARTLQDVLDDLPGNITNRMIRDGLMRKMPDGTFNFGVQPTMNVVIRMKNIIRKALPKNVLSGRQQADMFQGNLKFNLRKIRDVMAEGNPELVALNRRYRDFMKLRTKMGKIIWDAEGDPKSGGLAKLFAPGAERNKQLTFEQFSKLWPQGQQIMTDAMRFSRRQIAKRFAGRALLIGGGYEAGRRLLRPILGGFEGGGGEGFSQ